MQIVSGSYDFYLTRKCNFSVQTSQSCHEISNCKNVLLIMINLPKFERKLVYFIYPRSFKLFSYLNNDYHGSVNCNHILFNFGNCFFAKNAITFDLT